MKENEIRQLQLKEKNKFETKGARTKKRKET